MFAIRRKLIAQGRYNMESAASQAANREYAPSKIKRFRLCIFIFLAKGLKNKYLSKTIPDVNMLKRLN